MNPQTDEIQISGEPTLDPQVCRFIVSRTLHSAGSASCASKNAAAGSPLFERLLAIDGVREVAVLGNIVTVAKASDEAWPVIGKRIGAAIREAIATGAPLIAAADAQGVAPANGPARPSGDSAVEQQIRERVTRLFETQINPALASHGGFASLADVRGTTIHLVMGGGCQGCASAQATLRQGIERAIRQHVPEVTEVVDVTDHASGTRPYYR